MFTTTNTILDALVERYGEDAVEAADVDTRGEDDTVYFGSDESPTQWGLQATATGINHYKSTTRGIVWFLDRVTVSDDPVEAMAYEIGIIAD